MDATTGVIVLLFVFTIFSSLGGNKGYTPPDVTTVTTLQPTFSQPENPISRGPINATFLGGGGLAAQKPIQQYILAYRKPEEAVAISKAIMRHTQTYNVNPKLVTALIRRESGFNPRAISKSGAAGLGQLLPSTCKTTGVTNPYDIDDNAKGTVRYVKYLLDKFNNYGDQVSFALAGYLEGPNAVARKKGYSSTTGKYVNDILSIYHKL
ncbi:MAG: lytic transglycosylase domain-containing protein [Candidatus Margulisbacteria bacterium]|nr:lytic transglycosylase domain-containing protein [Candidatus Margulisiibacteriota bacterium]